MKSVRAKLKNYFLTGVLVTVPISLTIYILVSIIGYVDKRLLTLVPLKYHPDAYLGFKVYGIGIVATALLLFIVGILTQNLIGKKLVRFGNKILHKIPLVRSIYFPIRDFFEVVMMQGRDKLRRVVLVEYPRKGMWVIGFVTGLTDGEVKAQFSEKHINIFVPTTPNPTSGFYVVVPEKDVIPLDMTVQDAFKLIISGGIVQNQTEGIPSKDL
nr:DUF502 domain-containing protein [Desulfobacterales bacterium]